MACMLTRDNQTFVVLNLYCIIFKASKFLKRFSESTKTKVYVVTVRTYIKSTMLSCHGKGIRHCIVTTANLSPRFLF